MTWYDFLIGNMLPTTIGNIIGGAVIIGCLLYYVYDYRNRKQRAIFNFIEKMWRKLKERMRGPEAVPPTTLPTTTTDELDAEEDEAVHLISPFTQSNYGDCRN